MILIQGSLNLCMWGHIEDTEAACDVCSALPGTQPNLHRLTIQHEKGTVLFLV